MSNAYNVKVFLPIVSSEAVLSSDNLGIPAPQDARRPHTGSTDHDVVSHCSSSMRIAALSNESTEVHFDTAFIGHPGWSI